MTESRGFCRNKEQEADILAHGVPARAIFMADRGAETLEQCIASFRGRSGTLVISHDLRVFGGTKRLVADVMEALEKGGIKVTDLTHPYHTTVSQLVQHANVMISGARFQGDRPRARRQGRAGGLRKGHAAWNLRDKIAPRWIIDRIVDERRIPWDVKQDILEPHFNKSTLRRHYGALATGRKD